jgi:hypothetical protein
MFLHRVNKGQEHVVTPLRHPLHNKLSSPERRPGLLRGDRPQDAAAAMEAMQRRVQLAEQRRQQILSEKQAQLREKSNRVRGDSLFQGEPTC